MGHHGEIPENPKDQEGDRNRDQDISLESLDEEGLALPCRVDHAETQDKEVGTQNKDQTVEVIGLFELTLEEGDEHTRDTTGRTPVAGNGIERAGDRKACEADEERIASCDQRRQNKPPTPTLPTFVRRSGFGGP